MQNKGAEPGLSPSAQLWKGCWLLPVGRLPLRQLMGSVASRQSRVRTLERTGRAPGQNMGVARSPGALGGWGHTWRLVACLRSLPPHRAGREGAQTWTQSLALLLASCVALGKLLGLSVPQFSHPQTGDTDETRLEGYREASPDVDISGV